MDEAFWSVVVVGAFLIWIGHIAVDLEVPEFLAKWYQEPGNSVRAMTWVGSLFVVLLTLTSPEKSFLGGLRNDAISIAIAVIVIEELGRYRATLEEKERLIRQMGSFSHDFALEAVRLIKERGWHKDRTLCGRSFANGKLQGIELMEADLSGSDLRDVDLRASNLAYANLQGANLWEANLQGASLHQSNLQRAYLVEANLQKAFLKSANLQGANLWQANLQEAYLWGANLQNAILWIADLRDAKLDGAILRGAVYSQDTLWPNGFEPKGAGATLVQWDAEKRYWFPVEDESSEDRESFND